MKSRIAFVLAGSLLLFGANDTRADLVGLWRFDSDVDPQPDSSGKGNNGAVTGDAQWVNDGERGGVMSFDGLEDYLDVEDSDSLSIEGELTIAAWANFNQFDTYNAILGKTGSTNLNHPAPYDLYTVNGGDGRLRFYAGGGGPGATGDSSQVTAELPQELEEWAHIVVTVNADLEVIHYWDGDINGDGFLTLDMFDEDQNLFIGSRGDLVTNMDGLLDDVAIFDETLTEEQVLTIMSGDFSAWGVGDGATILQAGDANQDLEFNQLDLVQVQIAATYLSGTAATWGSGDWNSAPGGEVGSPPPGDGVFNQLDVIAALSSGVYLTGPYGVIAGGGISGDEQTSITYDPSTGEVGVDAPAGVELTSINIDSAGGIFTGAAAANLGGSFDNDADNNIFKATFGSSFGSISFGSVAQTGLSEDVVMNDLTVVGSLAGGGALGSVDLIYIPEPSTILLLVLGAVGLATTRRRRKAAYES